MFAKIFNLLILFWVLIKTECRPSGDVSIATDESKKPFIEPIQIKPIVIESINSNQEQKPESKPEVTVIGIEKKEDTPSEGTKIKISEPTVSKSETPTPESNKSVKVADNSGSNPSPVCASTEGKGQGAGETSTNLFMELTIDDMVFDLSNKNRGQGAGLGAPSMGVGCNQENNS